MSKTGHWKTLRQNYKELLNLFWDLQPSIFARQDWNSNVIARKSLDDNIQVEMFYLAEHFLLAWNDWQGMCTRYLSYFGQTDAIFPLNWKKSGLEFKTLAMRICKDNRFDEIISERLTTLDVTNIFITSTARETTIEIDFFHDLVKWHRWESLIVFLELLKKQGEIERIADVLINTSKEIEYQNKKLIQFWNETPPSATKAQIFKMGKNYQYANLNLSWLEDRTNSAFSEALKSEKKMSISIEKFIEGLLISEDEKQKINQMIMRINSAISEIGFDAFVEDILSDDFLGGNQSATASNEIGIIPGDVASAACCTVLLAVSKGDKSYIGFPKVMEKIRAYLIHCFQKTKVVIVLCDHWKSDMLESQIGDLREHYKRGVRFLFLMAGSPSRIIAPVAVDLDLDS